MNNQSGSSSACGRVSDANLASTLGVGFKEAGRTAVLAAAAATCRYPDPDEAQPYDRTNYPVIRGRAGVVWLETNPTETG